MKSLNEANQLIDRIQKLFNLLEATKALNSEMEEEDVFNLILKEMAGILGAEAGTLWVVNPDSLNISAKAVYGPTFQKIMPMTLKLDEGIVGDVIRTGKTGLIQDVSQDERWSVRVEEESGFVTRSLLTVPLHVKSQKIGALQLLNKQGEGHFNEEDRTLATALASHSALALHNNQMYIQIYQLFMSLIKTLARALDARDPYTAGHSERVAQYALILAEELILTKEEKKELERAALLHDIGKLGIPDYILGKQSGLTDEEYALMKQHTTIGAEILRTIEPKAMIQHSVEVALMHHERLNGSGYPEGRLAHQIPLFARIVGIADSFDAMTTDRPYKKGRTLEEGLQELERCRGTHYDAEMVDLFVNHMRNNEMAKREKVDESF
jgi:putative nucleotidyltransferase with HDIG domain